MTVQTKVQWAVQIPERERFGYGPMPASSEAEARAFVAAHPGCTVVKRTVTTTSWETVA